MRGEHVQQISAMHAAARGAVAPLRIRARVLRDDSPALPAEQVLIVALIGDVAHGLLEAECAQRLHRVWTKRHASADFLQLGLRLVDVDLEALLQERVSGRAASDATADHSDSCFACHATRDYKPARRRGSVRARTIRADRIFSASQL